MELNYCLRVSAIEYLSLALSILDFGYLDFGLDGRLGRLGRLGRQSLQQQR